MPAWLDEFREAAIADYEEREGLASRRASSSPGPTASRTGTRDDVDAWWESEEYGIRALAINTNQLIVQDLKAVEPIPRYQQTNSWTRGVQFVMAGGIMGILAAINDEVERSHIANITLILFVIFVLHSITYNSMLSGGIILLQISTATLLSLAYMALKGVGLNINTLPVQSVGVGIGVDYAIYIVDRIRQECVGHPGHRRSGAARRPHHRDGRELHRHHDRRRHRAVELLEPALPGRDGPAAVDPDGRSTCSARSPWCRPSTRSCAPRWRPRCSPKTRSMLLHAQKERERKLGLRDEDE